jgi:hypothetical protein
MKKYLKFIIGGILLLVIAGAGAGLYMFNLKPKNLAKAKPDFVMTATDLQKAFDENEAAATAKYVGKIIEVSGEIASVKTVEHSFVNVTLKTGSDMSSVICTFPPENKPPESSSRAAAVIRGVCSGYLMDVLLNNCAVAEK